MEISLTIAYPISEAYREKLQTFLDSVLAQGITENRAPYIHFPRMIWGTFQGILELQRAFDRRN